MTPDQLRVGGRYNWRGQEERLYYVGPEVYPDGIWHQFAKVGEELIWCEVRASDLHYFEESGYDGKSHDKIVVDELVDYEQLQSFSRSLPHQMKKGKLTKAEKKQLKRQRTRERTQ